MRFRRGDRCTSRPGGARFSRPTGRTTSFVSGFAALTLIVSSARAAGDRPPTSFTDVEFGTADFPCPESLRPRTEFWVRIFTEFGRTQKVLHDQRYPWIIYEVIDVAGLDSERAKEQEKERIEYYSGLLDAMSSLPPVDYSAAQHRLATLLREVPEEAKYTRAKERLRTQTGIRENCLAGLERSGRYLAYIHQVLAEHDVPLEVAFLPHVESSFNPGIRSHAGAVGLWQFTKDTGRRFMTVEGDIDERRDPYAASEAAAKYLRRSYDNLGSWPLAVVSYNYGLAGVRRAMDGLGTADIDRVLNEYDGPRFGFASQNFYCEFLAAIEIGRNPQRYFENIDIEPPALPQELALPDYVKFQSLCDAFGIADDELARWNPALGPSHRTGEKHVPKGFRLRLPVEVSTPEVLYASIPRDQVRATAPQDRSHRVVAGDTLAKIAHRYRVSLAELRGINGLQHSDRIFPGQSLVLP